MKFSTGIIAYVVVSNPIKRTKICKDSLTLYDFLIENGIEHEEAANAEGWSELAIVDETYNTECFDIYMQDMI